MDVMYVRLPRTTIALGERVEVRVYTLCDLLPSKVRLTCVEVRTGGEQSEREELSRFYEHLTREPSGCPVLAHVARLTVPPTAEPSHDGLFNAMLWRVGLALAPPLERQGWVIREWPHDHEPSPAEFDVVHPWLSPVVSLAAALLQGMNRDDVVKEWGIHVVADSTRGVK